MGLRMIHVSDSHVIRSDVTVCIVFELNLISYVIENGLIVAKIVPIVAHITPFNDQHLGWVSDFKVVG